MEKAIVKTLNIIISDDDPDDQYFMHKAVWETNLQHKITSVYNGIQLMDYLQRTGMYKNCKDDPADCIFLDLNMPLLSGTEALKRIKRNTDLSNIPVFILSTSKSSNEKENLITLGAAGFYTKSNEYNGLKKIILEVFDTVYKLKSQNSA